MPLFLVHMQEQANAHTSHTEDARMIAHALSHKHTHFYAHW